MAVFHHAGWAQGSWQEVGAGCLAPGENALLVSFLTPHPILLPPQVLVLRLRDSIIKMGEELEKAAESEAREKESTKYYQRRMEEMKADMDELVQRELESSRRRVELVRGPGVLLFTAPWCCPWNQSHCCHTLRSLLCSWAGRPSTFPHAELQGEHPAQGSAHGVPAHWAETCSSVPTACPTVAMPPLCHKSVPVNVSKQLTCSVCSKPRADWECGKNSFTFIAQSSPASLFMLCFFSKQKESLASKQ